MGFTRLLVLSVTMFLSTLAIGNLPLSLSSSLSPLRIRQISIYGVGLLVGASLTIIIPEGVDAVYESSEAEASYPENAVLAAVVGQNLEGEGQMPEVKTGEREGRLRRRHEPEAQGHGHAEKSGLVGVALISGFLLMFLIDQLQASQHTHHTIPRPSSAQSSSSHHTVSSTSQTDDSGGWSSHLASPLLFFSSSRRKSASSRRKPSTSSSRPLLRSRTSHPAGFATPDDRASEDVAIDMEGLADEEAGDGGGGTYERQSSGAFYEAPSGPSPSPRSLSTTIGLIAHSLADGISLGASSATLPSSSSSVASTSSPSSSSGSTSLDLVVFLAIMVHKAPAAFGLVAVLMSEGLTKSKIRQALLGFSAAAPVGALATWALLQVLVGQAGTGGAEEDEARRAKVEWWTGMALLFSGGTFLFVATHVMQESEPPPPQPSSPQPRQHALPHPSSSTIVGGPSNPSHPHSDHALDAADDFKERNGYGGGYPGGIQGGGGAGGVGIGGEQAEVGRWTKTVLMVLGMVSPMVLTRIVGHGH